VAFENAIRLEPRMAGHYYDLVRIRPLGEADRPLLQRMHDLSQRGDLTDIQRIMLELAIGKACDDLGDPQRAMQHYLQSNAMKGRLRPLDRSMIKERVDWAIRTFTADYFAERADTGSPDPTPLLILGMPRSGTTLVESILGCHSKVVAGQELLYWGRVGRPLAASPDSNPATASALRKSATVRAKEASSFTHAVNESSASDSFPCLSPALPARRRSGAVCSPPFLKWCLMRKTASP